MELLRGRPVAERIDEEVISVSSGRDPPSLSVYLVSGDRSSEIYARSKVNKGSKLGIDVDLRIFDQDVSLHEISGEVRKDGNDPSVSGIMIERPLPDHLDIHELMREVPPLKDVEGIHPENYGLLGMGRKRFVSPTPLGALMLMNHYGVGIEGSEVVVVGRSPNVGRPLAALLSQKAEWGNGTVTLVHSRTSNLVEHTKRADIIVTAVGSAGMLKGDMIKEGSVLIDLGINPDGDSIVGDVDMESVSGKASKATPTPGGTGPVTVSCMFLNLILAKKLREGDTTPFSDRLVSMIYDIDG